MAPAERQKLPDPLKGRDAGTPVYRVVELDEFGDVVQTTYATVPKPTLPTHIIRRVSEKKASCRPNGKVEVAGKTCSRQDDRLPKASGTSKMLANSSDVQDKGKAFKGAAQLNGCGQPAHSNAMPMSSPLREKRTLNGIRSALSPTSLPRLMKNGTFGARSAISKTRNNSSPHAVRHAQNSPGSSMSSTGKERPRTSKPHPAPGPVIVVHDSDEEVVEVSSTVRPRCQPISAPRRLLGDQRQIAGPQVQPRPPQQDMSLDELWYMNKRKQTSSRRRR